MGNDQDSLAALRAHVAAYQNGDKRSLGRMFALQEQLTGMKGKFVMLADSWETGPSQKSMRRGPLTGDCITFDHVEEKFEATLAITLLTDERLRYVTTKDSGLYTGKVAIGKAPDGPITVSGGPLAFEDRQYFILFGSDSGRSEFDFGHKRKLHSVEVVAGETSIVRWIMRRSSDRIRGYHKREWLGYAVKLMRMAEGGPEIAPQDESAWIDCLYSLGYRELSLSMHGSSQESIASSRAELGELLRQAESLGHGEDRYVQQLKRLYPELT
jgi:hypothetical protein